MDSLDYENVSEYSLTFRVCDPNLCAEDQTMQLYLRNVNEPPTFHPSAIEINVEEEQVCAVILS